MDLEGSKLKKDLQKEWWSCSESVSAGSLDPARYAHGYLTPSQILATKALEHFALRLWLSIPVNGMSTCTASVMAWLLTHRVSWF
eukprot:5565069-Amphidinium_carterae.2